MDVASRMGWGWLCPQASFRAGDQSGSNEASPARDTVITAARDTARSDAIVLVWAPWQRLHAYLHAHLRPTCVTFLIPFCSVPAE